MKQAYKTLVAVTALLTAGEAVALLLGMLWLSPQPNPWLTLSNKIILLLDVVLSLLILVHVYGKQRSIPVIGFLIASGLLFLTHGYRNIEYFVGFSATPFLLNPALLVVNNLKFVGLLLVLLFYKQRSAG